jgi:hypothetical protein
MCLLAKLFSLLAINFSSRATTQQKQQQTQQFAYLLLQANQFSRTAGGYNILDI